MSFEGRRAKVRGHFTSLREEDISFEDFIRDAEITKAKASGKRKPLNETLRDRFLSAWVSLDFSKELLKEVGWTKLEVKYLNKAFRNISKTFEVKGKTLLINKDELIIKKVIPIGQDNKRAKVPFRTTALIYKEVAIEAEKLIRRDFKAPKNALSQSELASIINKIENNEIDSESEQEDLYKLAFSRFRGLAEGKQNRFINVHAGHIEGHENFRLTSAAKVAIAFYNAGVDNIPEEFLQEVLAIINIDRESFIEVQKFIVGKIDVDMFDSANLIQKTVIELASKNISKQDEKLIAQEIQDRLIDLFKEWSTKNEVVNQTFSSVLSPYSVISKVEANLATAMSGGKANVNRRSSKGIKGRKKYKPLKLHIKSKKTAKKYVTRSKSGKINFKSAASGFKSKELQKIVPINVTSIHGAINEMLAQNVEEQMGNSGDPPGRLRYQTGTFADSAALLTLTRTQAGVLAGTYTYKRDPYDVFLNGRLATPQRDPRIYVEGAIREAALSILQKRFPGIVLELQ